MIPLSESAFEDWNEWIGEEEDMDGLRSTVFKNVKAQFFRVYDSNRHHHAKEDQLFGWRCYA